MLSCTRRHTTGFVIVPALAICAWLSSLVFDTVRSVGPIPSLFVQDDPAALVVRLKLKLSDGVPATVLKPSIHRSYCLPVGTLSNFHTLINFRWLPEVC